MKNIKDINTKELTEELLFKHLSVYDLWCYYTGIPNIKLGKKYKSPLRKENDPSSAFFKANDTILLKDFGYEGKCTNIWSFLKDKYGLSYYKALEQVDSDFNLGYRKRKKVPLIASNAVITQNIPGGETVSIQVKRGAWSDKELKFWTDYHITKETLNLLNIQPLKCYWIAKGDNIYEFCRQKDELLFVFSFGNAFYKIYRPESKKMKWYSNTPSTVLMNYDNLDWIGKNLYITKGMKEVCQLSELKQNVIGVQSENSYPDALTMSTLKDRFENIYTIFDIDKAGLIASKKYQDKYNTIPIYLSQNYLLENIKDLAEIGKKEGLNKIKEIINV